MTRIPHFAFERFPQADPTLTTQIMFRLTYAEANELRRLRSQFVTLKRGEHRKYLPYAFTEHGALMLANVLNSDRAAQTSVQVVRAFVRLRQMLTSNAGLARKLEALEKKYDAQFKVVFDAIRQLMSPPEPKPRASANFRRRNERPPQALPSKKFSILRK